jgi:hypothetical protein
MEIITTGLLVVVVLPTEIVIMGVKVVLAEAVVVL